MKKVIFTAILAAFMVSCGEDHTEHGEHDAHGTESKSLYAFADIEHGKAQSPINIVTSEAKTGKHTISLGCKSAHAIDVVNKGHTIQLDFEKGAPTTFDGKDYNFVQCHFHTPSEHLIDGMTYPMEMHLVHTRTNDENPEQTDYLVVGIMFKMGQENRMIKEFLNKVPKKAHEKEMVDKDGIYLSECASGHESALEDLHYYHYQGSLTTPPYTETVEWLVIKDTFEASQAQIEKINAIEGNNARHVQPMCSRPVDAN
ncbi:carbonic anhydrase family protein [Sediminitomix flava]|uniref:Carbonic anhydrase n=1 Tax=Sediminitomix flava TaxID=379075 RepID=A0A316A3R7_SEDFL|nr:carbonic anhydrase family protein [Sediminitomix flava]PWJ44377.1 carbonic anhydrase [Sediminitomix flava]